MGCGGRGTAARHIVGVTDGRDCYLIVFQKNGPRVGDQLAIRDNKRLRIRDRCRVCEPRSENETQAG
jgi:hypothetical protein